MAYANIAGDVVCSLGCFIGTQLECIEAISEKYSGQERQNYVDNVVLAFSLYKKYK
jgi:hypothetical protein